MKELQVTIKLQAPRSEFNPDFVQGMANAMSVAFAKYGAVKEGYPHKVNAVESAKKRIQLYQSGGEIKGKWVDAGNLRYLVDAANFLMIESMFPLLSYAKWGEDDSNISPGRKLHGKKFSEQDNKGNTQREKIHEAIPPKLEEDSSPSFYKGRQGD